MKLLVELSMECESLARAETLSAARALGASVRVVDADSGVFVVESEVEPAELASRLGLCHYVGEWLGKCDPSALDGFAKCVDVQGPIRVRSTKVGDIHVDLAGTSRRLGKIIGEDRGVDLHAPKSDIRVVYSKEAVYVGRALGAVDRASFEKRKNRYMPFVYPASLHPKFARAMVNLTQVPKNGKLLDPFSGTGAIVAEAALVHLEAYGTDFAERMTAGARKNLRHLGLHAHLSICDVGAVPQQVGLVGGIATDPPYGKSTSTKGESIGSLYKRAFEAFSEVLHQGGRVAVAVPDVGLLEGIDSFRILERHPLWVHRSLTRNFCVLERT